MFCWLARCSRRLIRMLKSVAEQHVEHVVAFLAVGFRGRRSCEGRALGWRDAIPVDHPCTLLNAVGDQVLRLSGRSRMTIHDVTAGEAWRAEEAETQCQGDGDEGLLHCLLRSLQRLLTRRTMPIG